MVDNALTRNEAKILQATVAIEGSSIYELAAAALLTPAAVRAAAARLHCRGCVAIDRAGQLIRMTDQGREVRNDISPCSIQDPNLKTDRSFIIATDGAADAGRYDKMSGDDISEAIDAEISKYGDLR